MVEYAKTIRKNGVSVLGDIGTFPFENKTQELVEYELFLPKKYDNMDLKGICLYHKKDFDRMTKVQRQELVNHHGMVIEIKSYC
jgi:hypothetical protein